MSGLQLSSARIHDARFVDCKLDDANVRMAEFARVRVDRGSLRGTDFTGSKGCDIAIFDADLERCDFTKSQLDRFMLHGSRIADVQGAIALRAATIDSSQQIPLALKLLTESGTIISDDRDS